MAPGKALLLLRSGLLVALAGCAALTIEYRSSNPSFCSVNSGCAALRRTPLAYLWGAGITLPELGLIAVSLVFALSLTQKPRIAAILTLVAGAVGALLIVAQALFLNAFCWLCMTVDGSSLLAALGAAAWLRARKDEAPPTYGLKTWAWAALAGVAVVAPVAWPSVKPAPPVPPSILAQYVAGKINVIEFADFECPWCRSLHARLKPLLAEYGERVHFVRLNMPLERHPSAKGAALAAICSEPSGKAPALAEFMFTTEDLSPENIRREVANLGLDLAEFDRCLAAPATQQRLTREMDILKQAGFEGLPTTYVGSRRLIGAQPDEVFRNALDRAARGDGNRGVPGWGYLLIVLGVVASILRFGLERRTG
ncbi:MAG TPA: thioredoxin domain-containing protein [Polyangiaceae bacterium]|nr:thioredoxin domain-containing protein [Polyangiaceae bacterium]